MAVAPRTSTTTSSTSVRWSGHGPLPVFSFHLFMKSACDIMFECSLHGKPRPVRLTATQIKYSLCHRPRQFLYQSTHRHPFITRGVFPEWSHKYLYGKTSNLYTSRAHGRQPLHLLTVHPSMHLSDPGGVRNSVSQRWRPV